MTELFKDRVMVGLAAALAVFVLAEALVFPHYSPKFPWHHVPGYSAAIGLLGCIFVVLLSKWLGKAFLQIPEQND